MLSAKRKKADCSDFFVHRLHELAPIFFVVTGGIGGRKKAAPSRRAPASY
jgi:hypothetical protein